MSRKQFDRMELLTDETEVDRTFLHSKLHAIVHVPFSVSRALAPSVSIISFSPFALHCSTGSNHQIRPGAGCKYLLLQKSWHTVLEGAREFEEKRERNAHRRYFKRRLPPISRDLIQDLPYLGHVISFFDQRFNGIPFYFAFFLPSSSSGLTNNGSRAMTFD